MNDVINKLVRIPLSKDNMIELLNGKTKVLTYSELKKYDNIDDLLYPYDNVIILYIFNNDENNNIIGHWVCLLKTKKNTVEYFNSYGKMPDDELNDIPYNYRYKTDQIEKKISKLMKYSKYNLEYNEKQLQKLDYKTATCGYYVILRLLLHKMKLEDFQKLFNGSKDNDKLVVKLLISLI